MTIEDRLNNLLSVWQEQQAKGCTLTATDLCTDCPELAVELENRIAILRRMTDLVQSPTSAGAPGAQEATLVPPSDNRQTALTIDGTNQTLNPPTQSSTGAVCVSGPPGYEILAELGRGGMGVVYKARQLGLNRLVALKMVLAGGHASREERTRFHTEAEAIARLRHPNIVQVFEVGETDGKPYLALEFLEGGSLDRRLASTPLPPREAARLVEVLARAMHAAHQAQVVHRDLKPANVLLTADGILKVTDFGLAKKLDEAGQTHSGAVMGTPSYMAPEQASGQSRTIGPAVDVYALGAILYECLTGRPPFKAATSLDTVMQVVKEDPVPPRRLQPKLPLDLETVCLKCLHKEPSRRYANAAELAEDLRRFQAGEPILARPVGVGERFWRWCKRNPALASLSAASLVLLVGSLVAMTGLYLNAERHREHAEAERRIAVSERKQADLQRQRAERERQRADEERDRARSAAVEAQKQKQAAETQRHMAREEADRARQVTHFLVGLFEASDPLGLNGFVGGLVNKTGEDVTARALLDRAVKRIALNPHTQPAVRAAILDTVGTVYRSQGRHAEAENLLKEALAIRRQTNAPPSELATSLHSLAWLNHERGNYPTAVKLYQDALKLRLGETERDELAIANNQLNLAWVFTEMERYDEAEHLLQEVIARREKKLGSENRETALAKMALAALYLDTGRHQAALPLANKAVKTFQKLGEDRNVIEAAWKFQRAVMRKTLFNDSAGEEKLLREVLQLVQKSLGPKHIYVALPLARLAFTLEERGQFAAAESFYRQALDIVREKVGLAHPKILVLVDGLANLARRRGKAEEGDAIFEEVLAAHKKRFGATSPFVADVLVEYGSHLGQAKQFTRQEELLQAAAKIYRADKGLPRRRFIKGLMALGTSRLRAGPKAASEPYFREAVAVARKRYPRPHPHMVVALEHLANALIKQGRITPEVDALLTEGESILPKLSFLERQDAQPNLLISRCNYLRLQGKHAEVVAILDAYRPKMPAEAWLSEELAFQYTLCIPVVEKTPELPTEEKAKLCARYGTAAVALLRQARRQGIANPGRWKTHPSLQPLRGREDYRLLMNQVGMR